MFSIVQRKDRLSGGTAPQDGTGRLPGKPEQNAVPMKGDTMAITRAGNGFPTPVDKHHIFSVHTAVPSNLYAESGMKPGNLQNTSEKKLGYTDESYTAAVDNGSYKNFVHDSAGYGLAQWTYWSRKEAMLAFHQAKGASIGDALTQAEFLYKELSGSFPAVLKVLKTAASIRRLPTPCYCSLRNRGTRAKPSGRNGRAMARSTKPFTGKKALATGNPYIKEKMVRP